MARKYDWEAHLTPGERVNMDRWAGEIADMKAVIATYQEARDGLRREAVQRARTAFNRRCRALVAGMEDSK